MAKNAQDVGPDDIKELREQFDMALVDPDFAIIENYVVNWEEI